MKIAVLCGGPSPERGISLNSARSVMDHLISSEIEIIPIYFDHHCQAFRISRAQLYSNTPSDFDFKLQQNGVKLSAAKLARELRAVDLVFPAMHGRFGEDGTIQRYLEKLKVPFVGSPARGCERCFDKFEANELLAAAGFFALPSIVLTKKNRREHKKLVRRFFADHAIDRAVVKPAIGGSSIGVFSVGSAAEALPVAQKLLDSGAYERVVVEEFCRGREFTAVIVENRFDIPVCLLPVEIEADYSKHQIFDYRKKYLPTRQVTYHCPPRFDDQTLERVQAQAEQLFRYYGLRDFARFDGWVLPDGRIWFSDFNPVSGMEQNSFLFLQGARIGLSHREILRLVVGHACQRYGIPFPAAKEDRRSGAEKTPIAVLFGGGTAERQVSVMSGTNVWLKLRRSKRYQSSPYLLDPEGAVWALPYSLTLNHTVEEIYQNCRAAESAEATFKPLRERVLNRLALRPGEATEQNFVPTKMSLDQFLSANSRIFIALHGGIGEDGTLQELCQTRGIKYNGSGPEASRLGMDKAATGAVVAGLNSPTITTAKRVVLNSKSVADELNRAGDPAAKSAVAQQLWSNIVTANGAAGARNSDVLIKPSADGCSAGIVRLRSATDLEHYLENLFALVPRIPAGTLTDQSVIIEMPTRVPESLLCEEFIETDRVQVVGNKLNWQHVSGWIEVTVGVVGPKGKMRAMSPSITVASGDVLSVEEKFQGGTGVNITPPPPSHVPAKVVARAKKAIETVATAMGLSGYARIDAFMNITTGAVLIIEANTLPGLTPSTVIYHQALAERKARYPLEFLEHIVDVM